MSSYLFTSYRPKVSKEARGLAKKYFEFVTKVLQNHPKSDRMMTTIDNWAKDFDGYARETKVSYQRLDQVLDWYMATVNTHRYTYPCPIAFLDHFRSLEQRWQWSYRPIPAEELTDITDKLLVESWPGNVEDLITVVSKSVATVRSVLQNVSGLPDLAIKGVERCITSVNLFVIDHFTQWRKRNINRNDTPLWTAEISENTVLDHIVSEWKRMGYSTNECQSMRNAVLNNEKKAVA